MAFHLLDVMFSLREGIATTQAGYYVVLVIAAWWGSAGPNAWETLTDYRWKPWHGFLFAAVFGACLAILAGGRASPFLYFQF